MELVVSKVTGFSSFSPVVFITKGENVHYYRTIDKIKRAGKNVITFNMPVGVYDIVCGDISELAFPVVYNYEYEFKKDFPDSEISELDILIAPNINKATVNVETAKALVDNKFNNAPEWQYDYVISHEYGHNAFRGNGQESEQACDEFAVKCMFIKGYNPCQIIGAIDLSLSDRPEACIRKNKVYYKLQKLN